MALSFDVVVYLLGLACTAGIMVGKLAALEKKVDMHNSLIDRMYKVENSVRIIEDKLDKGINRG